jgi:Flp pilus assembly protein CpaB
MFSSIGQNPSRKESIEKVLMPGMKAMAIVVKTVDNLVIPGSSIDVIQTVPTDQKKTEEKIILEYLRVLALDMQPIQPGANRQTLITATLELTSKQVQALAKVKDKRPIKLRLHPPPPFGEKGGKSPIGQDDGAKAGEKKNEAKLPHGMELFGISVGPGQVQGGFVLCGIFLDISYQTDHDGNRVSRTVAENVMVRSADATCNLFGDGPPTLVTMMVSEEQARTLKSLKCGVFVLTVRKDNFNSKGELIRLPP